VAITGAGVLAAMRVRISDSVLLGDLTGFLEAAECRVRKVGEATLDVTMPRAPSAEQAQREIDIYLKTWQAMHPGAYARIVSEGRAGRG
jgi:MOSC domain-containing protein YiiM